MICFTKQLLSHYLQYKTLYLNFMNNKMSHSQQHSSNLPPNASDPVLVACWDIVKDGSKDDYIKQQSIVEWLNRVLAQKNLINQKPNIKVQDKLHEYIKQVHQLDRSNITNVSFKYEEAVDFYNWFIGIKDQKEEGDQDQHEQQNSQEKNQQQDQQQLIQKEEEKMSEKSDKQEKKGNDRSNQIRKVQERKDMKEDISKQQQQTYLYPKKQGNKKQEENQFHSDNEQDDGGQEKQQGKEVTKNYREYLNTIFDHYCRMSYATGNDPTFEQIQQKTQVMTINKFMIFCKDFGIVKLNNMSRPSLVEIFKKNSEYYKQMNFEQFMTVLLKISFIVFSPDSQTEQTETSKQFEQFLLFLQVNNITAFKKKTQSLSISLKPKGTNQNQSKKIIPANYKFKFSGNNKPQQPVPVKQQVEDRKRIKSQNKFKVVQNRPRNSTSKKQIFKKAELQLKDLKERNQTNQPKTKIGPLPPVRKAPSQSTNKSGQEIPSSVTGYANIHKLKMMGKHANVDSRMKLNNVVQQAKKMLKIDRNSEGENQTPLRISTHGRDTPYSNYSSYGKNVLDENYDISRSVNDQHSEREFLLDDPLFSKRSYVPHGHSKLQKKNLSKQKNEELKGIIDNDSDQDEYLEQHLNRQKKSGPINQRIERKIKQYQQKVLHN